MKNRKIRYAVVGQGYFSQMAILPAFEHSKNSELVALVSGHRDKLKKLGRRYRVKNLVTYEEYDDFLRSGQVDAVYIALPNWMHREYAERAARAGVHVLCEKPMAVHVEDCASMISTAEEMGVKLMVAYRLHFEEANLSAVDLISKGKIGDARIFNSVFSFPVKPDNIRANAEEMGGGPVYDIGIYCINASRYLFQAEPVEVFATAGDRKQGRNTRGHETVSVLMKFPDNRVASFTCSFGVASVGYYDVIGTKGEICLENSYEYYGDMYQSVTINEKSKERVFKTRDQIAPELDYFSNCVLKNLPIEPSGYEGMLDVMIIQAILRSLDSGMPVPLSLAPRKRRPTIEQAIRRPKLRKRPRLVKAEVPSKKAA